MAGHSKWANIKHRKAAQDAKRGKVFTKIIRELVVAAKQSGPIPEDNPRLRAAVDKALGSNMKKDTIDKAIQRGAGTGDEDNYEEITYEGYGVGGGYQLVVAHRFAVERGDVYVVKLGRANVLLQGGQLLLKRKTIFSV